MQTSKTNTFPQYEQHWIFWALIFVGVYTFSVRGGVFCNAQTANIALFSMSLGIGDWSRALYLLIPMTAYFSGTILSEYLNRKLAHNKRLQWGAAFVALDMAAVVFLGFLPKSAPDQICQVTLNFICSMQFNTFRKNEGTPMSTTFVTSADKNKKAGALCRLHGSMIGCFMLGGLYSAIACKFFDVRAIFGALPVLLYIFIRLLTKASAR